MATETQFNHPEAPGSGHRFWTRDELSLWQLRDEIRDMLRYLLETGTSAPESLLRDAAAHVPPGAGGHDLADLVAIHAQLSKRIAPATPISLRETAPMKRGYGLFIRNAAVNFFVVVSIVSLVLFVGLSVAATVYKSQSTLPLGPFAWLSDLAILASAALGASFYSLWTARKYIQERTFDPRYNQVYVIRFLVGLLSGTILGYFGESLIPASDAESTRQFGTAGFAIIGGFSAEAVVKILQRVAETLVTLVSGPEGALDGETSRLETVRQRTAVLRRCSQIRALLERDTDAAKAEIDQFLSEVGRSGEISPDSSEPPDSPGTPEQSKSPPYEESDEDDESTPPSVGQDPQEREPPAEDSGPKS